MKIFGWCADASGCGMYRIGYPFAALRGQGLADARAGTVFQGGDWDIVVGQRISMPRPSALWRELGRSGTKLVYEVDDDLFNIHPSNVRAHQFWGNPNVQHDMRANIEMADAVTTTTHYLANKLREHSDNVHVLPNCIPSGIDRHAVNPRPVVGWAGSPTHTVDLENVSKPLRRALKRLDAPLHLVGADHRSLFQRGHHATFAPGVADVGAYYNLLTFDIGLAPLAPIEFNRSKSAVKAIEYGARGIPTIASDYGPYADYIQHGVDGFLVKRDHEWEQYARMLMHDPGLLQKMSNAAHAHAQTWRIENKASNWMDVYSSLVG